MIDRHLSGGFFLQSHHTAAGPQFVNGSQICKAQGGSVLNIRHGAPLGNTKALKQGFYRPTIRQDEYAYLLTYAEQFDLGDKLAFTLVQLR